MEPGNPSLRRMSLTSAKSKMFEFGVPPENHIEILRPLEELLSLAVAQLGDLAAAVNREVGEELLFSLRNDALFGAQFFEELNGSREFESASDLLLLFAAASNYLSGLPGNARVLANEIQGPIRYGENELAAHLVWLLQGADFQQPGGVSTGVPAAAQARFETFFSEGHGQAVANDAYAELRARMYVSGGAEDLLLADVIAAVAKTKMANSSWSLLPLFSGLSAGSWSETIAKNGFVKELWPSQQTLGREGVLRGRSAILQLPTGAGKTRAAELIIRSAFLSARASLAILVAPFRALCQEIRADLAYAFAGEGVTVHGVSDVLQDDFVLGATNDNRQILVVTPEKLAFMLRADPNFIAQVGLAIFDEAHQFDSGSRGVLYELLLSSLRDQLGPSVQRVLISAVIGNAKEIGDWFLPNDYAAISGFTSRSARTSLAFTSWKGTTGRINYVKSAHLAEPFFVPRVIQRQVIAPRVRETTPRYFPSLPDSTAYKRDVALYLAMSLSSAGAVAIYCSSKSSVRVLCARVAELRQREAKMPFPSDSADQRELSSLATLIAANLGEGAEWSGALEGVFPHHGEVPSGLRLAIEHALRKGLIKCVISTSTLAQGVNLPLKYLIVSSFQLGAARLSTRDFQNLMGRVSRPGMHTEGSIIVADPEVFESRNQARDNFGWREATRLTTSELVEACSSSLLEILQPVTIAGSAVDGLQLLDAHLSADISLSDWMADAPGLSPDETAKILRRLELIATVENFLLARANSSESTPTQVATVLAASTLAHSLSNESDRENISEAFSRISAAIELRIPEEDKRRAFGSSMYGAFDSEIVLSWLTENSSSMERVEDATELAQALWPLFEMRIKSGPFRKCTQTDAMRLVMDGWLRGASYADMHRILDTSGAKISAPKNPRAYSVGDTVSIGEGAFAFEASMIVGAVRSLLPLLTLANEFILDMFLDLLQRQLKYGLPAGLPLQLCELGFADRTIAMQLAALASGGDANPFPRAALAEHRLEVERYLEGCPDYFRLLGDRLLGDSP
jgi:POLQ-like helicase